MKFRCECGAKFAFDVTPEMLRQPVRFVCPTCGRDSSTTVNASIRSEAAPVRPAVLTPAPPAGRAATKPAAASPATVPCPRHRGQMAAERCRVCGQPICPLCMKLFGHLCSPLCRQKAERSNLVVPEYAESNQVQERRYQWKLNATIIGTLTVLVLFVGGGLWYRLVSSQPRPAYTVRFPVAARNGSIRLVGRNDLLILHGGTLSRHDVKQQQQLWSVSVLDRTKLLTQASALQSAVAERWRRNPPAGTRPEDGPPPLDQLAAVLERESIVDLSLHVRGEKIWIAQPDKIVGYDWRTGKSTQEVPLPPGFGGTTVQADDLVVLRPESAGAGVLTRLNLLTGQVSQEKIHSTELPSITDWLVHAMRRDQSPEMAAFDPARIAAQAQRLPVQGRLALPATISIQQGQNRLLQEIDELDNGPTPTPPPAPAARSVDRSEHVTALATLAGPVEFSHRLLEERFVERSALRPASARSALDGAPNAANMAEMANELLNQNTRMRGEDKVIENASRYQVVVRFPTKEGAAEWQAEVTGPPSFHPLTTLNLVVAGKSVIALDPRNRRLWEHTLTYPLGSAASELTRSPAGSAGVIVERAGLVLLADQGVLTALEAGTGNVRWRLPCVGVSGLFFDDAGMLYVNGTTADPESLKYAKQIDVTKSIAPLVVKMDPNTGAILWRLEAQGTIAQVADKYLYTLNVSQPDDASDAQAILGLKPAAQSGEVRLRRLNSKDGSLQWEFQEPRSPIAIDLSRNSIQLLYPNEARVLRFMSF